MLRLILVAFILVSINVSIHATGMVAIFRWVFRQRPRILEKFGASDEIWLLIRIFAVFVSLHLAQICAWAAFYALWGALEDFETATFQCRLSYHTASNG